MLIDVYASEFYHSFCHFHRTDSCSFLFAVVSTTPFPCLRMAVTSQCNGDIENGEFTESVGSTGYLLLSFVFLTTVIFCYCILLLYPNDKLVYYVACGFLTA